MNTHQPTQPPPTLPYDNFKTSSAIFSPPVQKKPVQEPMKYGKPTYSPLPQNPLSHRSKADEILRTEPVAEKKQKEEPVVKDPRNRTPVKKYTVLRDTANGSFIREQPRFTIKDRQEKYNGVYFNGERQNESILMTPQSAFHKQIPTDRGYHTFPVPSEIQQQSPITRPKKGDVVMPENQQHYFQYILQYSYRSKKGTSIVDVNKVNQDSYVTAPNLNNQSWLHYFGVCDGHGANGQLVSSYVKKNLPLALQKIKNIQDNPKQQFMNAFKSLTDRLPADVKVDLGMSGSTSVGVYLSHNKLFCLNLGDSKAVLGSKQKQTKWKATALSIDHKPSNPHEATRIMRSNGRIDSYYDENGQQAGPLRVWLKNEDTPGLAMTRCFGDQVAAQVGVISIPEIREFTLTERDKIIIVATDGIWEFLSEQQVIQIVAPYYEQRNLEGACNVLLETAVKLWKEDNNQAVDDITFVLLFLDYNVDK